MHIVIFELNFILCFNFLNFIKYILETKTSLEWSKYSFKIDFHILKGLKTSLEVKILKNDKNCQKWSNTPRRTNVPIFKKRVVGIVRMQL